MKKTIAIAAALLTLTAAASVVGSAVVTADSLRMRSEANTDCATVTYLTEGTSVQVYEELEEELGSDDLSVTMAYYDQNGTELGTFTYPES